ncbi:hypothetical protein BGW36DRAFT_409382 [Talaromyces proteolyticus]|uniref:Uncharacterized protein n=1 Tax=Talaromyces proteolyticus TaxID=1131652 RepID=A0AAD4PTP2_9EURO|nr:uncharacterized protein BGW36DRAFT_409382 [Talaromyces proteolyticus]KAH8693743.1 hypothetical protein BGW36DRAFT_409382 [Talaromyces proteolyticus]
MMSLKRKASFTSFQAATRTEFCSQAEGDIPQHLHSRTRKRFRDNRPDEQTVYEKTLRILYEAQKRHDSPRTDEVEEPMPLSPPPSDPGALDPRQQTLRKFFQPVQASPSINIDRMSQNTINGLDIHPNAASEKDSVMETERSQSVCSSGSSTPVFAGSEMDTHMNMDMNMNANLVTERKWIGFSWVSFPPGSVTS